MKICDYMSAKLIVADPEMKIHDALDLMKKNDIHRLPVVDSGRLIGLVTEGLIKEALPSKATSLSIYEVNYLLNQTTVKDIMVTEITKIAPDALLEDGIAQMRIHKIGVLPVVEDQNELVGIITNNDIFDAFLNITGYNAGGTRVQLFIPEDHQGILAAITKILATNHFSILTVTVTRLQQETLVEVQIESDQCEQIRSLLQNAGYKVRDSRVLSPKI